MSLFQEIKQPTNITELDKALTEQQRDYEAALGAFLVAFNAVEAKAYRIIFDFLALRDLVSFATATAPTTLSKAIEQLKSLKKDFPDELAIDLGVLKELSEFRNKLAHASYMDHLHYDDDGAIKIDFQIASHKNKKSEFVPLDALKNKTEQIKTLHQQMLKASYSLLK